jgi:hypothetical protein
MSNFFVAGVISRSRIIFDYNGSAFLNVTPAGAREVKNRRTALRAWLGTRNEDAFDLFLRRFCLRFPIAAL